jgi:hypothetical protein
MISSKSKYSSKSFWRHIALSCFLCVLGFPLCLFSQSVETLDSLKFALLKARGVEDSIQILCQITWNTTQADSMLALEYGTLALRLADRIQVDKLTAHAVDAFMPMSYLVIQQWSGWRIPVPLTPLHGVDRPGYGTNPYSIDCVLDNWTSAGVPASKIVMGVGGFGSAWCDINHDNFAPITPYANTDIFGAADGEMYSIASDNAVTWKWVKQVATNNLKMIEAWDDTGKCLYWHSPATNDFFNTKVNSWDPPYNISLIFYETPRSISEKYHI